MMKVHSSEAQSFCFSVFWMMLTCLLLIFFVMECAKSSLLPRLSLVAESRGYSLHEVRWLLIVVTCHVVKHGC